MLSCYLSPANSAKEMMIRAEVESSAEEFGGIMKRKRTAKRQRNLVFVNGSLSDQQDHRNNESSVTTTEEEVDMANCLILLARSGDEEVVYDDLLKISDINNKAKQNNMDTVSSNHNYGVYECKTCDKAFRSFQALGGHRASHHKKPKLFQDEPTSKTIVSKKRSPPASSNNNFYNEVASQSSSKVHECSICGSAFSSGQALGGHMRRHRATAVTSSNNDANQMLQVAAAVDIEAELLPEKAVDIYIRNDNCNTNNNFLASLDLNMPAPQEEEDQLSHSPIHRRRFIHQQMAASGQSNSNPSTTAPPLVGCYF